MRQLSFDHGVQLTFFSLLPLLLSGVYLCICLVAVSLCVSASVCLSLSVGIRVFVIPDEM